MEFKTGQVFRLQGLDWKVKEVIILYENRNFLGKEYKLKSENGGIQYLEVLELENKKFRIVLWKKQHHKIVDYYTDQDKPKTGTLKLGWRNYVSKTTYNNIDYSFKNQSKIKYVENFDSEVISYIEYSDDKENHFISVNLGEDGFESYSGKKINKRDITHIREAKKFDKINSLFGSENAISIVYIFLFVVLFLGVALKSCRTNPNSWDSNSEQNDTIKKSRSNNYYRSRSRGFGK